jgi:2-hydroxy-3-oxopropionate reductase
VTAAVAIGFIGLGTMGGAMVRNLLRAGYEVRAHDARPEAIADAVRDGAHPAASIAEAAAGAAAVVTMLPDTPDVQAVVLGQGGLLENPPAGRLVIDMSTIAPGAVRQMHARLKQAGIDLIDAPVSGGPQGAKAGTLSPSYSHA